MRCGCRDCSLVGGVLPSHTVDLTTTSTPYSDATQVSLLFLSSSSLSSSSSSLSSSSREKLQRRPAPARCVTT